MIIKNRRGLMHIFQIAALLTYSILSLISYKVDLLYVYKIANVVNLNHIVLKYSIPDFMFAFLFVIIFQIISMLHNTLCRDVVNYICICMFLYLFFK